MIRLQDETSEGEVPLTEIDPFTVFATFNRGIREEHRRTIISRLEQLLGMDLRLPSDFSGIPVANNMQSWFFAFAGTRKPTDIPDLWSLAQAAVTRGLEGIPSDLFDRCLEIETVGIAKLTMGLFWMRPDEFMPCDSNSRDLLRGRGIEIPSDFRTYSELIARLRPETSEHFAQLSYQAWHDDIAPPPPGPDRGARLDRRRDGEAIRRIVEEHLPIESERMAALRLLLRGIRRAHERNPRAWGTTLRDNGKVRLNVGRLLVLDLKPSGEVVVVAIGDRLPASVRERYSAFLLDEPSTSCPDAVSYAFPSSELPNLDSAIIEAHLGERPKTRNRPHGMACLTLGRRGREAK